MQGLAVFQSVFLQCIAVFIYRNSLQWTWHY